MYSSLLPLLCLGLFASCQGVTPNRNPVGEAFPMVSGEALDGDVRTLPSAVAGRPAVFLIGYEQDAQFDLDRWFIGLSQMETPVAVFELPTIPGMIPGMFSGTIANGMRSGIPDELWGAVVTLYGDDASKLVSAFGNEKPRTGRVALVDGGGTIVWFHDRGFSPLHMKELDAMARELPQTGQ